MSHILSVQPYLGHTIKMMEAKISSKHIRWLDKSNPMVKYGIVSTIHSLFDSLIQRSIE